MNVFHFLHTIPCNYDGISVQLCITLSFENGQSDYQLNLRLYGVSEILTIIVISHHSNITISSGQTIVTFGLNIGRFMNE